MDPRDFSGFWSWSWLRSGQVKLITHAEEIASSPIELPPFQPKETKQSEKMARKLSRKRNPVIECKQRKELIHPILKIYGQNLAQ